MCWHAIRAPLIDARRHRIVTEINSDETDIKQSYDNMCTFYLGVRDHLKV